MVSGGERKTDWQSHIEKKVYSVYRNWERHAVYFVAEGVKGQWLSYTAFYTRDLKYIESYRNGILLYKKKQIEARHAPCSICLVAAV